MAFIVQIYSRYRSIVLAILICLCWSCKKNNHPVPNIPFNITINLDLPSYQPLISPGGYAYATGGSRGLFIYRYFEDFIVLDRHATYDSDNPNAIVDINPDNQFELLDTCSGSRYAIYSGAVVAGPAEWALRKYYFDWDGASTVVIYN